MRHKRWAKISPAFDPFLREAPPNAIREAIVIYRRPSELRPTLPAERLSPEDKLKRIKDVVSAQAPLQAEFREAYNKASISAVRGQRSRRQAIQFHSALSMASVPITRKMLPQLAAQEYVAAIMPNQRIRAIEPFRVDYTKLSAAEKRHGFTWGLNYLGVKGLWDTTKGGGVAVAVLDTGVHADHPDLAGRVRKFMLFDPLARRIQATPAFDAGKHGTHVCGTIAGDNTSGVAIGVAPEVDLLVGAVLVGEPTLKTLIEAIIWAVEEGADIINMSLGFTYYEPNFATVMNILADDYSVMPVVAVGNENHGSTSCPGNAADALSVGALEKMRGSRYQVTFFSSGASLVFPGQEPPQINKPDVVAPGVQIWSAIPPEERPGGTYLHAYFDGTSMAAPHVSGIAALLMSARPKATARDIMTVLRETAKHPGGNKARPDNRYGWGTVQPRTALDALSS